VGVRERPLSAWLAGWGLLVTEPPVVLKDRHRDGVERSSRCSRAWHGAPADSRTRYEVGIVQRGGLAAAHTGDASKSMRISMLGRPAVVRGQSA
jgi:hypothetical protein